MVSEPPSALPSRRDPHAPGALIEASFTLWGRSWTQTFWFAVVYGVATLLPGVALGGMMRDLLMQGMSMLVALAPSKPAWAMLLPSADPVSMLDRVVLGLRDPMLWVLGGVSVVLIVASTTALLVRQAGIVRGSDPGLGSATRSGLARTPATLIAWLIYTVIVLATAIPFLALTVGALWFSLGASPGVVLLLVVVILVGGVLSSVPLAWASIAFGFAPFTTALEQRDGFRAQTRSLRLVHGHWWRCAVVVSTPLLIYLGVGGTVSSLLMVLCGAAAYLWGGWTALFDPGWLLWSQLLAVPLQAPLLALAFAGGVVMFEDLRLRAADAA